ncbi:MAG: hypothetical protein JNM45_08160 [Rhizobiales bacterium]|nr:hypothetical protein [Hyphomicrobiales bacterium]
MTSLLDKIDQMPWLIAIVLCLTLGLAPFLPEPHIVEKLRMLARGALTKPLDMFDLALHATPFLLLLTKLALLLRGT